MTGRAVAVATVEMRDKMFEHASEMLECAVSDLELRPGGAIGIKGVPKAVELQGDRHALAVISPAVRSRRATDSCLTVRDLIPSAPAIHRLAFANLGVYTFGAHCVEVDVDEATGAVEVRRAWCAHDAGRAINPVSCEGQIQGGFVQGMGYALTEAMHWNDEGWLTTVTLADYKSPGRARYAAGDQRDRARGSGSERIRSAPRASASRRWSAPRPPSPTRSATPPARACDTCR